MSRNPKAHCPNCHSCEVIPLLSPLPGFSAYDTVDIGRLPVGQCAEREEDLETEWRCEECGEKWQEKSSREQKIEGKRS